MSFKDIFKSDFMENLSSVSLIDMTIALLLALILGLFIYAVYKKTFQGVMYSTTFGVTLVAMTMITTLIILAVTSNVVLSLGMVGALSIVRFRTAIKEPLDTAFLFWAIAAGIVLAAGMIPLAMIGSLVIGIVLVGVSNHRSGLRPYIVVLRCDGQESEDAARSCLQQHCSRCVVRSKTVRKGETEIDFEVRLKEDNTDFISQVAELKGVSSAVLVSCSGEYMA